MMRFSAWCWWFLFALLRINTNLAVCCSWHHLTLSGVVLRAWQACCVHAYHKPQCGQRDECHPAWLAHICTISALCTFAASALCSDPVVCCIAVLLASPCGALPHRLAGGWQK